MNLFDLLHLESTLANHVPRLGPEKVFICRMFEKDEALNPACRGKRPSLKRLKLKDTPILIPLPLEDSRKTVSMRSMIDVGMMRAFLVGRQKDV